VTFRDGTTVLGTVPLNAFGQTMLTTNALVGGVHKITAAYSGDVTPLVTMSPSMLAPTGGNQPHNNLQPYLTFNFCIALQGVFPPRP
jgi:microcystin-dependent protein